MLFNLRQNPFTMLVVHHPDCLLHDPPYEILSGSLTPYFESPERIKRILSVLDGDDAFVVINELDKDVDVENAIVQVHSKEYVDYIRGAYEEWVKAGGNKVSFCELD